MVSDKVAEIDEMNRHVADVRLAEQRRRNDGEQQCMGMEVECDHGHETAVVGGQADDEDLGQYGGMENGGSANKNDGNDQDVDQEAGIPLVRDRTPQWMALLCWLDVSMILRSRGSLV